MIDIICLFAWGNVAKGGETKQTIDVSELLIRLAPFAPASSLEFARSCKKVGDPCFKPFKNLNDCSF